MSPGTPMIVRNTSVRKSLCLFTEFFYVKNRTNVRRVGAAKSKRNATREGSMLWSSIPKRKGNTKINEQVKKYLYNCILQHTQVVQSPIANDRLKVSIDGPSEPQLVSKLLLKVSVPELHNSMVSPSEEGGIREARDSDNNIIIIDSTLQSILPPQINKMSARNKFMCSCECCISDKSIHSSLL